jgi:hypothetical protein
MRERDNGAGFGLQAMLLLRQAEAVRLDAPGMQLSCAI